MLKKYLIILSLAVCTVTGAMAQGGYSAAAGKLAGYHEGAKWYKGLPNAKKHEVDVLFFAPTSVNDNKDSKRNLNIELASQRSKLDRWHRLAEGIFGESADFYAPYYRQVTMESWGKPYFNECYDVAVESALEAFDYYMKFENRGRPFILAGHSQGASIVLSIIKKRINSDNYSKLVAAYAIGYRITPADLKQSTFIVGARGEDDTGVVISYHSSAYDSYAMFPGNVFSINPMNWRCDDRIATPELNVESVLIDDDGNVIDRFSNRISAQTNLRTGALVVKGVDPNDYYKPYLGAYRFAKGNYHIYDLQFFYGNLKRNVATRTKAYLSSELPRIITEY